MVDFDGIFGLSVVICGLISCRSSERYKSWSGANVGTKNPTVPDEVVEVHNKLIRKYIIVYLLATMSDWLQGPFVYALYMDYGFQKIEIAQLFVAGFALSMVFGSFVGGMADWGGRRNFVIIYALVYIASCATKHFNDFNILMLGRLLSGVSTSLLYSVFDAWLIRSHSDAELPKSLLSKSFSTAAFGNSIIAIVAGLIGNKIVDSPMKQIVGSFHVGRFLNPFDLAILSLTCCGLGARFMWDENYGHSDTQSEEKVDEGKGENKWYSGLTDAFVTTIRNRDILLCGIISALFEGSMYIFVFMWTPLLKSFLVDPENDELPYGVIFSTFMVCCMTGSSLFSILVRQFSVEKLGVGIFAVGAMAMISVALHINETVSFMGMNLFEVCVGMYFPIMGTMKGSIVPEDKRAAIYNLYRIPLNFIVVLSLLTDPKPSIAFGINSFTLSAATLLQAILAIRRNDSNEASDRLASKDANADTTSLIVQDGSGEHL